MAETVELVALTGIDAPTGRVEAEEHFTIDAKTASWLVECGAARHKAEGELYSRTTAGRRKPKAETKGGA